MPIVTRRALSDDESVQTTPVGSPSTTTPSTDPKGLSTNSTGGGSHSVDGISTSSIARRPVAKSSARRIYWPTATAGRMKAPRLAISELVTVDATICPAVLRRVSSAPGTSDPSGNAPSRTTPRRVTTGVITRLRVNMPPSPKTSMPPVAVRTVSPSSTTADTV